MSSAMRPLLGKPSRISLRSPSGLPLETATATADGKEPVQQTIFGEADGFGEKPADLRARRAEREGAIEDGERSCWEPRDGETSDIDTDAIGAASAAPND